MSQFWMRIKIIWWGGVISVCVCAHDWKRERWGTADVRGGGYTMMLIGFFDSLYNRPQRAEESYIGMFSLSLSQLWVRKQFSVFNRYIYHGGWACSSIREREGRGRERGRWWWQILNTTNNELLFIMIKYDLLHKGSSVSWPYKTHLGEVTL